MSTITTLDHFTKIVRLGEVKVSWAPKPFSVFCRIEYNDGRLSITGVEGPQSNGDAIGSCGQIDINPASISPAPGWDKSKLEQFKTVWNDWHLNDMRAGCKHQRKIDTTRQVEVVSYKLTAVAYKLRNDTLSAASEAALRGQPFNPTPTERALAELDTWFSDIYTPPDADSPLSGCYEVSKREQKAIGWVTTAEHPDGMLSKPCDVCGYKYGSAWLREEVSPDVLEFLQSLPETDKKPAWV